GTQELAIIVDDPDAPTPQPWVHWVLYKIPATESALPEGTHAKPAPGFPAGALQGKNSWGSIGYRGPEPPRGHGVHHYHFKIYALDGALNVTAGLDKPGLLRAMKGHILEEAELVGTYERK
ncbi:MAG: YbhB/YbcL family Raf kinase inhibitor-like protein, partial [Planctomycetaceae bacterium]|nr:YbhB/YbcL family Raf kinase inhibitor-like protein [Planctomycetaceae bacterium]